MKLIYRGHPFTGGKIIGTITLENGAVKFNDIPEIYREELEQDGVYYKGKVLKTKDGEEFLRALAARSDRITLVEEPVEGWAK